MVHGPAAEGFSMIETRLKLWKGLAAAMMGVSAFALPGCGGGEQGEGGEKGRSGQMGEAGEAGEAGAPAGGGEAGEAAIGESGAEHGEAGAAGAYAGLEGPARSALRLQQLKGFVLVAERVAQGGQAPQAGALVGQGLLEVYTPAQAQFGTFNPAPLRAAESAGLDGKPASEVTRAIAAAKQSIEQAQAPLTADPADLAGRMIDIATGIYQGVNRADGVDTVEYQHSLGAALAARDALQHGERALRARDTARYAEALRETDRLIALWPAPQAPEHPATYRQVLTQASRAKLALSSLQ
jgi:hypothetical protein